MKIQKKKFWRGGRVGPGGSGGGGRVGWGGARVDVNEELKFLGKYQKKNIFFWGGGVGPGVGLGGM